MLRHIHERPVLVSPTGSGKTYAASQLVHRLARPTLWLAHRRELVQQAAGQLAALGLRCGILQAGFQEKRWLPVQVGSVQTLARRELPPAELIVVDECHHAVGESYRKLLAAYPSAYVLGLTATPFRLDGRGLGSVFRTLIVAATTRELCDDGTLVAPSVFAPPGPTMQGVKITAGDYNLEQAAQRMDTKKLTGNIVTTWLKRAGPHTHDGASGPAHGGLWAGLESDAPAGGRRTVVFAINVAHSQHITERFVEAGVRAEHLDGTVPAIARAAILRRLRTGETTVLSNCMVLTEGWDLPALEVAVIARPTASLNLHLQMLGRIMRAAHGKAGALVLDHAGNHGRHGAVTDDIEYSLEDQRGATVKKKDGEAPTRTCPSCYLVCPAGCHECPECGHAFTVDTPLPEETPGELVPFEARRRAWEGWEAQRKAHGFRDGYSLARYRDAFGEFPVVADGQIVDPATAGWEAKRAEYRRLVAVARRKGWKEGWAAVMFQKRFGTWPPRQWKPEVSA